jgi:hypothetical protein
MDHFMAWFNKQGYENGTSHQFVAKL